MAGKIEEKKIYGFAVITFSHGGEQITPIGCFLAENFLFLRYNKSNTWKSKKKKKKKKLKNLN